VTRSLEERRGQFMKLYSERGPRRTLNAICKSINVTRAELDTWIQDRYFLEDLIEIDKRKAFFVREYLYRHLEPIAENMVLLASTGSSSNAVSAARMILEIVGFLQGKQGAKPANIQVNTQVNAAAREKSERELLEEHGRLSSLLATAKRVSVEDEGSGSGTDSPVDSGVGAD